MRTIHRFALGVLVGLVFVAGYAARMDVSLREHAAAERAARVRNVLAPGTQLAAAELEGTPSIDFRPVETLYVVTRNLREHFVEQLTPEDEGKMTHGMLKAMLASLNDPNTVFLSPEQKKITLDALDGKYHGIGAVLTVKKVDDNGINEEHLMVVTALDSGPAEAAGIKPGDDIIALDGKAVLPFDPFQRATKYIEESRKGKTSRTELRNLLKPEEEKLKNGVPVMDAQAKLVAEMKDPVELTIRRKGVDKEIKVKVQPKDFTVETVERSIIGDGNYGLLRINCFSKNTGAKVAEAIDYFKTEKVRGLVLDMRDLAAGDMEHALGVAKHFVPGKKFVTLIQSRNRKTTISVPANGSETTWSGPMVVLVNRGTARLSELVAAAIKENGAAKLVGEKTFGDFAHATFIELDDGSAIMLTTGKFVTSKGGDYSGLGLPVDIQAAGETCLDQAIRMLGAEKGS